MVVGIFTGGSVMVARTSAQESFNRNPLQIMLMQTPSALTLGWELVIKLL